MESKTIALQSIKDSIKIKIVSNIIESLLREESVINRREKHDRERLRREQKRKNRDRNPDAAEKRLDLTNEMD